MDSSKTTQSDNDLATEHSPTIEPGKKSKWDPKLVDAVIELFETFGLGFEFWQHSKSKDEVRYAKKLWMVNLQHLDPGRIRKGIHYAIKNHKSNKGTAPTIAQFLAFCRIEPAHQNFKALPLLQSDQETGRAAIQELRGLLGRTTPDYSNAKHQLQKLEELNREQGQ